MAARGEAAQGAAAAAPAPAAAMERTGQVYATAGAEDGMGKTLAAELEEGPAAAAEEEGRRGKEERGGGAGGWEVREEREP